MAEVKKLNLICQLPAIKKLDNTLMNFPNCEHLALSTNAIEKIQPLVGFNNLKILSLGRNSIKRIEKLEEVSGTLEQLWLSYNQIDKLDGIQMLRKLKVLYISNNKIKMFDELLKLRELPDFEELLLIGNPCYDELEKEQWRREVLKRVPKLKKLDGVAVSPAELEKVAADKTEFKQAE